MVKSRTQEQVASAANVPLLLIVDDSRADRLALESEVVRRFAGHRVEVADSLAAARAVLDVQDVAVALVDHLLGDGSGLEIVEAYPDVSCIIVTGTGSERVAAEALRRGAFDYLIKDEGFVHVREAGRAIEAALAYRSARRDQPALPPRAGPSRVRFGGFELDLVRNELREFGELRAVHRTPMRLLVHLIRNADRTVSKEELLETVWDGTVVSDMAIASALKELRHLLRDDGSRQEIIETHRGSGYRFVAPVSVVADPRATSAAPAESPAPAAVPCVEPLAYDAYLTGKYQYRIYTRESVAAALEQFLRAIEYDPRYAAAHAAVAECYQALCSDFEAVSAEEAIPRARSAANRALGLDPLSGEAHAVHGALLAYFEWRWPEAEAALQRAILLCPDDPACLIGCARLSSALGRTRTAVDLARRALTADPLNLSLRLSLARVLWCDRRCGEALTEQLRVAAMDHTVIAAQVDAGASLHYLGRFREAVEHWQRAMTLLRLPAAVAESTGAAFAQGGIGAYWRRWIELAGAMAEDFAVPATWMWFAYAATSDAERALDWLERQADRRSKELAYLKVSPFFDPLRGSARFQALLRRVGLEERSRVSPPAEIQAGSSLAPSSPS